MNQTEMQHNIKKLTIPACLVIAAILSQGCRSDHSRKDKVGYFFNQLAGTWKMEDRQSFENWERSGPGWSGSTYTVNEKDTLYSESFRIVMQDDEIYYRVLVYNQNDGIPVDFKLGLITETDAVFENPAHDFPQMIHYRLIGDGKLLVEISGRDNGETKQILFSFTRD